jgi:hypothetical protein
MWLPWFMRHGEKAALLHAEEVRSSNKRSELYTKLFEGQKRKNELDEMVRKSLDLLKGDRSE